MSIQRAWETEAPFSRIFQCFTAKLDANPEALNQRWRPAPWDITEGSILWLPRKSDIDFAKHSLKDTAIRTLYEKAFCHPILVLKVLRSGPEDANVEFTIMTRYPQWGEQRHYWHIRKSECEDQFDEYNSLFLDKRFSSAWPDSKVRGPNHLVGHVYSLPWEELRCYQEGRLNANAYKPRLSEKSFTRLTKSYFAHTSTPRTRWVDTLDLWETFEKAYCVGNKSQS